MTQFFTINTLTHLHVGSGDSNYGVIDKLVQRDPTNLLPCIYASSLKGAFREFFKIEKNEVKTNAIFGLEDKSKIIFHQAMLHSIPVRCNLYPYISATSSMVIQELIDQLNLLNKNNPLLNELKSLNNVAKQDQVLVLNLDTNHIKLEDYSGNQLVSVNHTLSENMKILFGTRLAIFPDSYFMELCSDYSLPVIARNNLENGQSKNLWYEQIVPRASKFFFAVTPIDNNACTDFFDLFKDEQNIQIGANATIGYGLCSINKI